MMEIDTPFRRATLADAAALAELVQFASEGLALCLWTQLAGPGGDPWDIGRKRVSGETGGISYRNALIADLAGRPDRNRFGWDASSSASPFEKA